MSVIIPTSFFLTLFNDFLVLSFYSILILELIIITSLVPILVDQAYCLEDLLIQEAQVYQVVLLILVDRVYHQVALHCPEDLEV